MALSEIFGMEVYGTFQAILRKIDGKVVFQHTHSPGLPKNTGVDT